MLEIELIEKENKFTTEITNLYTLSERCDICKKGRAEFLACHYFNNHYLSFKNSWICIACLYQKILQIKRDLIDLIDFENVKELKIRLNNIYFKIVKINDYYNCSNCNKKANYLATYANNSNPEEFYLCLKCLSNLLLNILNQI